MELTFIHDGPVFYDSDGNYYEFAYHELLERYSYLADEITFMMRTKPIDGTRKFTLVPKEIQVIDVPNFKSLKTFFTRRKEAASIVEKQVRKSDYIVLRSQSSIAQLALPFIKRYKKPYIIESVGCSWDSYWNHGLIGKMVAPYMYLKTRNAIKNADYVYYVTTEFLQRRYPTNGKTVSCSNVVIEPLKKEALMKRIERIDSFDPHNRLVLGTAAAIDTRYKGHEYVIKAIPRLVELGYNVEYRLAGGNTGQKNSTFLVDLARKLKVSSRVIFCGSLSASEMPSYYDSLDIYIQPSKQEGLPRAVIEAMSRGCPVVGTDIAGIPELIRKECLFHKGSTKAVIEAIDSILKMDLSEIADENFQRAASFERDKLVSKRIAFYDVFIKDIEIRK